MGYEVTYKYHERTDDGYNRDEIKTFKKKVGDPFDDIPLEKLAGSIMCQLARRDVWIVDVEVLELSKKVVNFREAKNGIILKNKKFLFDGSESSEIVEQELYETSQNIGVVLQQSSVNIQVPQAQPHNSLHPHNLVQQSVPNSNQSSLSNRRIVDWVIFSPELPHLQEIKQKSLKFTVDKKYPVYEKKMGLAGDIYLTVDDHGREQQVSDKYFVPGNIKLLGDKDVNFSESTKERDGGKLFWGDATLDNNMPDLRRR